MPQRPDSPGRVRRFVAQYLVDRSGQAAAIRAGYSPRSARQRASELLKREDVQRALEQADAEDRMRYASDRERLRREVAKLAYANVAAFVKGSGRRVRYLPLGELAAADMAAVASITVDKEGRATVKLFDKCRALELLARLHGMIDEPEQSAPRPRARVTVPGVRAA